uniref:Uncharacterized protein n=1 Tax=Chlamydomonas euryale TaxID=1486919 RepID=A0A7R9VCX8_9CHLO|mmetsp:Transcript_31880/g.95199  ORF Transcript_31880/g.95199 Transcript_31880/m.95199 type:complete len:212 (+) Transcript_31880:177-812(+)
MHGTLRAPARHIAGAATAPRPTPCICGSTTSATSSSNVGGGGGGIQVVGTVCRGLSVADAAAPSAAPGAPSSGRTRQYTRIAGGSRSVVATAAVEVLGPVAGMSPSAVQDVLVGGAVIGAVGAALVAGLIKEPVVCDLCQGNGGTRCFACSGEGSMDSLISRDEMLAGDDEPPKRRSGMSPRGSNPRACKVCRGAGLIGCSKCKGSGYVRP